ncbi:hypothetical protein ES332_D05G059200v1 [Gossypium tomentosum]|uniref:F-box domain-containing protein n=1 Tax=Gossypium tomentosum TaxID=34277 RepID=A0A5D2KTZ9_GOSTO|nr:hypothetical protein ES332_D05G059200v1 [Gossypium tomentosum]
MECKEGTGETDAESVLISDWAELTHECLLNILSRLTFEHRWSGPMLVCKPWFNAGKDPSLNSVFDLETRFDSSSESTRWWTPEFERRIDSMLRSVITWSNCNLTQILTRHCSDLSLNFAAQRNCPNLKILKRNLMNWLDPSQHVGIVPDEYLNACPQDEDTEAAVFAKFMPQLEHLEIRFSKLSAKGLGSICEGCSQLEHLDLSGCANLTSRDILNATSILKDLKEVKKPNFYIPRSVFHTERYGHWRLYDERFQTDVFRI